jgi:hypothetical protein
VDGRVFSAGAIVAAMRRFSNRECGGDGKHTTTDDDVHRHNRNCVLRLELRGIELRKFADHTREPTIRGTVAAAGPSE